MNDLARENIYIIKIKMIIILELNNEYIKNDKIYVMAIK